MENVKVEIKPENGTLIVRNGKANDIPDPINLQISGIIDTPLRFLEKRITEINQKKANVKIDREGRIIYLTCEETEVLLKAQITGQITLTDDFKKFKINTGEGWTTFELADFIRMNRSFFSSNDVAAKLVTQLRDFKVKVDKQVESTKDDKANYSAKKSQAVQHNMPDGFSINVRIFKGQDVVNIPVEININPETFQCVLMSPDANDLIKSTIDKAIDEQINEIEKIAPDICIIEI